MNAVLFGLFLIPCTYFVSYLLKITALSRKPSLPEVCKKWNKYYSMEITLFFSGLLAFYLYKKVILKLKLK